MEFSSISISAVVKNILIPPLSGKVHSVFNHAINIAFGSELIGITRRRYGNSPFNILVDIPDPLKFDSLWKQGDFVCAQKDHLVFSNHITINLKNCAIWDPDYPSTKKNSHLDKNILENFFDTLMLLPLKGIFWQKTKSYHQNKMPDLRVYTDSLMTACKKQDETTITTTLTRIIGSGNGLTPSGDDFLCGFVVTLLYAARLTEISCQLSKTIDCLITALDFQKQNTTWTSQMMLKAAVKGWIIEPAIQIISDIFEGSLPNVNSITKMWSIGHSSGADMIAGIYQALNLIYHDQNNTAH